MTAFYTIDDDSLYAFKPSVFIRGSLVGASNGLIAHPTHTGYFKWNPMSREMYQKLTDAEKGWKQMEYLANRFFSKVWNGSDGTALMMDNASIISAFQSTESAEKALFWLKSGLNGEMRMDSTAGWSSPFTRYMFKIASIGADILESGIGGYAGCNIQGFIQYRTLNSWINYEPLLRS